MVERVERRKTRILTLKSVLVQMSTDTAGHINYYRNIE
jgi:hypothetical protein